MQKIFFEVWLDCVNKSQIVFLIACYNIDIRFMDMDGHYLCIHDLNNICGVAAASVELYFMF